MPLTPEEELELRELKRLRSAAEGTGRTLDEQAELEQLKQQQREDQFNKIIDDTLSVLNEGLGGGLLDRFSNATNKVSTEIKEGLQGKPVDKAIAGMRFSGAPGEIVADAVVGQPAGDVAAFLGASPETQETVRNTATTAAEVFTFGGIQKGVRGLFESVRPSARPDNAGKIREAVVTNRIPPVELQQRTVDLHVTKPSAKQDALGAMRSGEDLPKIDIYEDFLTAKLKDKATNAIGAATDAAVRRDFVESTKLYLQIIDKMRLAEFDPKFIPEILQKYDLSSEDWVEIYGATISGSGRVLQGLSTQKKQINAMKKAFANDPKALAALEHFENMEVPKTFGGTIVRTINAGVQNWRGMLVTLPATAMRNVATQFGRITVASLDEVLQPVFKGKPIDQTLLDMGQGMNHFVAMYSQATKEGRAQLDKLFDSAPGIMAKAELFSQPVHEVHSVGHFVNAFNWLNRAQEFFTRRVGFEASMKKQLREMGETLGTANPKKVPKAVYEKAVDHALTMSMQANPKDPDVAAFVRNWATNPFTALINPFPRFGFGNLAVMVIDHSPFGYLHAISPDVLRKVAKGDSEEFAKAASQATIGTLMLQAAINIRSGDQAGEKYNQLKSGPDGNQREDLKPFAPFVQYFAAADAIVHGPHRLKPEDYVAMSLGVTRPAGTSLAALDIIRQKDNATAGEQMAKFVGQYIAGYTTFFRQFKDYATTVDPQSSIARNTRSDNSAVAMLAPTINNFPGIDKYLPESYTLTREGAVRFESPTTIPGTGVQVLPDGSTVGRQVTGRTSSTTTQIENKINELRLNPQIIYPRTGIVEADQVIAKLGAPLLKQGFQNLKDLGHFDKVPEHLKEIGFDEEGQKAYQIVIMGQLFTDVKARAKKMLAIQRPDLFARLKIKSGTNANERTLIDQSQGIDLEKILQEGF